MIYDIITLGAGGAGLFVNVNLPKKLNKLIFERNKFVGVKVLMSGGERANLTNIDIDPENDYFSCTKKASIGFLKRWTNFDTINFFESNGVKTKIEDRGRVITASGHARDIVKVLEKKVLENNTKILLNKEVIDIDYEKGKYVIILNNGEKFYSKNVIVSVGGKSYPQVGTVGFAYKIAEKLGIDYVNPYKGLCGLVTKEDLSEFSGTTIKSKISVFYKDKLIYSEYGPILFTHWGISGPCVFNLVVAIGNFFSCKNKEIDFSSLKLEIDFNLEEVTKKLRKKLNLTDLDNIRYFNIQDFRSWKEAKVTGGGIKLDELTKYLESKKYPGLFFIGEAVDITGKTGGFNLQWAWSSAFACSEKFM